MTFAERQFIAMGYTMGKRERIVGFLCENSGRSYALEEICAAVLTDGRGRSTVYRLVSELVAEGSVRRLSDGRTRHCTYQYIGGEPCHRHLHLKCNACGKVIHLDDELSHELGRRVMAADGFTLDEGALLYGRCRECTGGAV